jgi:hypothetical protein
LFIGELHTPIVREQEINTMSKGTQLARETGSCRREATNGGNRAQLSRSESDVHNSIIAPLTGGLPEQRDESPAAKTEQLENLLALGLKILCCHGAGCMAFIEDTKTLEKSIFVKWPLRAIPIFWFGVATLPFEGGLLFFCAFALTLVERLRA